MRKCNQTKLCHKMGDARERREGISLNILINYFKFNMYSLNNLVFQSNAKFQVEALLV